MFKSYVRTLLVSTMVIITVAFAGNAQTISSEAAGHAGVESQRARPFFTAPAAGNIETIAGNGLHSSSGSGGPATSASIGEPCGLVLDPSGNIFFTNAYNNMVSEVNAATGVITTIAGNGTAASGGDKGPATKASLNDPCGIALDANGNVYIAEFEGDRVRMVDKTTGIITTVVGTGAEGFGGDNGVPTAAKLDGPGYLAFDGQGNLYIADTDNKRIRKVTPSAGVLSEGVITTVAGTGAGPGSGTSPCNFNGDGLLATQTNFCWPEAVAVDASGNLYISDEGLFRVFKVTEPGGLVSTIAGNGTQGKTPYTPQSTGLATTMELNLPFQIAFDSQGNLYFSDEALSQIFKIDPTTDDFSLVAGSGLPSTYTAYSGLVYSGDGGPAVSAGILYPGGVAVDSSGNLYIADEGDARIREVAPGVSSMTDTPNFSPLPNGDELYTSENITITDLSPEAVIYYTTNGDTPTTSSTEYTTPILLQGAGQFTLKAIAKAPALELSVVNSGVYGELAVAQTPVFAPPGGPYTAPQSVTISSDTPDAVIYYTTNGSTPTTNSSVYSTPIAVNTTETIKAITTAPNYQASAVVSASYYLTLVAPPPTISPAAGIYGTPQTVSITDTLAGAVIYYTTDGTTPTTSSLKYTAPFTVSSTETVQAIATATYYQPSTVVSAKYTFETIAATPTFSLPAGTYNTTQYVNITSTTPGAVIYYTTDGTTPVAGGNKYTSAIIITTSPVTIKALAVATGYLNSAVASAMYYLAPVTPTFSPVAGTYYGTQSVTISDSTPSTIIHYTTDGSTPTEQSNAYAQPIKVSASETIQAIAAKTGYSDSTVGSAAYVINSSIPLATPVISPDGGTFAKAQTVTITDATSAAVIYYTTDGSTPTTASIKYTAPFAVSATETIEAIATGAGHASSSVATAYFTIQAAVTPPTFNPTPGTFYGTQSLFISDAMPGATVYYTTDGTTPTTSSKIFPPGGQIYVRSTETVEAMATLTGFANSPVVSGTYTVVSAAATPTFSEPGGTYNSTQMISLSDTTPDAVIYYTTNGSTPTTSSPQYFGPITVSSTETIQAIGYRPGINASPVASATYTITLLAATPVFSPVPSTYIVAPTVGITDTTPGAVIYYTTDGTTPTAKSTRYTAPIAITTSETLQAIAVAPNYANSAVATGVYNLVTATPYFSPTPGTYTSAQTVGIQDDTPNSKIYYTTDGTTPTATSTLYGGTFPVLTTTTIKAIAIAKGYVTGAVGTGLYTINLPPAATPTFTPPGGSYGSAQTVSISDDTSGATIFYTTNGSTPTTSSTQYGGPFTVASTKTVQAIAMAAGHSSSAVGSATYTIGKVVAVPTFSPAAGTYPAAQTVSISDTTAGATIYYTTNGTTPTTGSTKYVNPISVSASETIEAIGVETGYTNSAAGSAAYTIETAAATPTFSPVGGTYGGTQTVSIADTTPGAVIYYTVNGVTPTTSSAKYTNPITVSSSLTIEAIAVATGYNNSAVGTAAYTIQTTAATPVITPAAGTYSTAQTVSIGDTTPGATIYYTTNSTTPTTGSTKYTGPITVSSSETVEAIAVAAGYNNSAVASATYTIAPVAATPTYSPAGGTYTTAQTVTISDTTAGAVIYYTTNGTTPSTSSTKYTSPITVSSTETIEAIASGSGLSNSNVASATYTIESPAATPTFSPAGGTYTSAQTVTISTTTPEAVIYYTTNGTTPTASSNQYYSPITVPASETLQAIAVATGYANSAVGTAVYTINLPAEPAPTFSLAAGTIPSPAAGTNLFLGDADPNATIYYTTDGTSPLTNGRLYSGLIVLSGPPVTIQAYATGANHSPSAVVSASYTLAAYAPGFSPGTGTYNSAQSVTLTDATGGASIYYTTNGSTPTPSSTPYTGPFTVSATETVNAMATYPRFSNSTVSSATYTIQSPAATPTFSPGGGSYNGTQTVTISDTTPGAKIYYTTNGTTPTSGSTLYTTPISVSASETVEAIAVASGYATSAVGTANYTISAAPGIMTVSAILPEQSQTITITGSGFGTQAAYSGNSPYIAFDDNSGVVWGAGNGGDAVGLDVTSWTNTQIVIAGLPGAYGVNGWQMSTGDNITIIVYNPQTDAGPYTCSNIVVGAGATTCTSSPAASLHASVPTAGGTKARKN